MRRPAWINSLWQPVADRPARASLLRDRLAGLLALITVVCLGATVALNKGTSYLMPGPLSSAHGSIEKCSSCHSKSGDSKVSWVHGLVAGNARDDSKACLTCHKMPETAFNAHSAPADVLKDSTARLSKIAAQTSQPPTARAQSIAFPTDGMSASGLVCATCHQEHQGINFKLNTITNDQCRSCHTVKFDSFDGNHPKFENYPFKKRTQIIYDHAGHFGKHYPEVAKKEPGKRIPATCSACHNSNADKRIMAVVPFDQTCSSCHLDQITGKERASGPKGIAFLSVPGLDLETLKTKNAAIGDWPADSEAPVSPFMKVMISRTEQGRALIKTVDGLNLQDLASANQDQIKVVTELAWEIKTLFHALISGKASDVLGDLNIGGGAKLSAALVADLTASIPRDVVISAQQQWLPNLATEMANRHNPAAQQTGSWGATVSETDQKAKSEDGDAAQAESVNATSDRSTEPSSEEPSNPDTADADAEGSQPAEEKGSVAAITPKLDPPACVMRVLGQCLVFKDQKKAEPQPDVPEGAAAITEPSNSTANGSIETRSIGKLSPPMRAGVLNAEQTAAPHRTAGKSGAAGDKASSGKQQLAANDQPPAKAADQTDDLLAPTEEELRDIKAHNKASGKADAAAAAPAVSAASTPAAAQAAPGPAVISIDSTVDPESWAEYGGWYRQDHAIFYRPAGHKDKFIYSWLFLTGPQAPKGDTTPVAAVFDALTHKDAQGSCTKCHSIDDIQGRGRRVNFAPPSLASKQNRFTTFIHEPHFGLMDDRGCLTCHNLNKGRPYLKSYEQGDAHIFESSFGAVKKELCQTCHKSTAARQDCLTCHKYHLPGVSTPIMSTKIPNQ